MERKKDMTVRDAGRNGVETAAERRSREFYEQIRAQGRQEGQRSLPAPLGSVCLDGRPRDTKRLLPQR